MDRIERLRAAAKPCPADAGLDAATALDDGNGAEFGADYAALAKPLPNLRLIVGCCGSSHRHVAAGCNHLHSGASEAVVEDYRLRNPEP